MIVQFGGQTPLNLARALSDAGAPLIGTPVDAIEDAEDREKFSALLERLGLRQPPSGIARTPAEARDAAERIGYPLLVRPSFVLGGRAMEICYDNSQLDRFVAEAFVAAEGQPVLIDSFLEGATEIDVDAICDGETVVVPGIMEHIEEAGVHSGDSACAIPAFSLTTETLKEIRIATVALAKDLGVIGLMNVQYAVRKEGRILDSDALRHRGQPTRQPHRAVRRQGDRSARGAGRREGDGGRIARGAGRDRGPNPASRLGQGSGFPVHQIPRRRHRPGARDEVDRRGDGRQPRVFDGVREEPDRGRFGPARWKGNVFLSFPTKHKDHG